MKGTQLIVRTKGGGSDDGGKTPGTREDDRRAGSSANAARGRGRARRKELRIESSQGCRAVPEPVRLLLSKRAALPNCEFRHTVLYCICFGN